MCFSLTRKNKLGKFIGLNVGIQIPQYRNKTAQKWAVLFLYATVEAIWHITEVLEVRLMKCLLTKGKLNSLIYEMKNQ